MTYDEERIERRRKTALVLEDLWRGGGGEYESRIELHSQCEGRGYLIVEGDLVDYHKREYAPDTTRPCVSCGGSGRVRVVSLTTTLPYEHKEG